MCGSGPESGFRPLWDLASGVYNTAGRARVWSMLESDRSDGQWNLKRVRGERNEGSGCSEKAVGSRICEAPGSRHGWN